MLKQQWASTKALDSLCEQPSGCSFFDLEQGKPVYPEGITPGLAKEANKTRTTLPRLGYYRKQRSSTERSIWQPLVHGEGVA